MKITICKLFEVFLFNQCDTQTRISTMSTYTNTTSKISMLKERPQTKSYQTIATKRKEKLPFQD